MWNNACHRLDYQVARGIAMDRRCGNETLSTVQVRYIPKYGTKAGSRA